MSSSTPKYKSLPSVRRFARFLRKNKVSYAVAGAALRVSGHTIWAWRNGVKLPSAAHQERIEKWTHGFVERAGWTLGTERKITDEIEPFERAETTERRTGTSA